MPRVETSLHIFILLALFSDSTSPYHCRFLATIVSKVVTIMPWHCGGVEPECDSLFANIFRQFFFSEIRKLFRQSTRVKSEARTTMTAPYSISRGSHARSAPIGVFDSGVGGLTVL